MNLMNFEELIPDGSIVTIGDNCGKVWEECCFTGIDYSLNKPILLFKKNGKTILINLSYLRFIEEM